jgi:hypothetical protein
MKRSTAWKAHERRLAKQTGGRRNGPTGTATADVETPWLCIEAKAWQGSVKRVEAALAQAERAAKPGQLAIAVLHTLGRHSKNDLVILRWGDFRQWFGDSDMQGGANRDRFTGNDRENADRAAEK